MKTNNPKTTTPNPQGDQVLIDFGRLALVALSKLSPNFAGSAAGNNGLSNVQTEQQHISSTQSYEPDIANAASLPDNLRLTWTHSKIALVELIYAVKELGVFNHGEADLKTITRSFEYMFSVELGNISSSFQEILERKKGYTNITDKLRDAFLKKVESSGRG